VEGATLLSQAEAAGWRIEAEFGPVGGEAVTSAERFELATGVLERVASTRTPQPVLGVVAIPARRCELSSAGFVVAADAVADPGNVGTILRSAEAAGADAVALTTGSVDPFNPKAVRASAGALFHVPVVLVDSLADLRVAGLRVLGSSSHHGTSYTDVDWTGRVALVVGNEAHGLAPDAAVDEWVTIHHSGRAESLNVAMAATVLCFEIARRRG
jgi:TrmH family RNA methyltransferase